MLERVGHKETSSQIDVKKLSKDINSIARAEYPALLKKTGQGNSPSVRFALRIDTPYPYKFSERSDLLPQDAKKAFGGVVRRNREEGMREIHDAIGGVTEEHHWLFVPSKETWIDDTLYARSDTAGGDQYLPTFLSYQYPKIEMVHTHPDKTFATMYREKDPRVTENYFVEAAVPSDGDFIRYKMLSTRSNPDTLFVSSVVSHHGITTFESNEQGRKIMEFRHHTLVPEIPIFSWKNPIDETERLLGEVQSKGVLGYDATSNPTIPIFDISFTPITKS